MKKIAFLLLALLLPMVVVAETVEIDGVNYNLMSETKEAEVTINPNRYKGKVVIPNTVEHEGVLYSVTSIGNYSFSNCGSMTSIVIGSNVRTIGLSAFSRCISLTSVIIPESVTTICESAFYDCSSLTSISIPNTVKSIGDEAFQYCGGLKSIPIPNSITEIGKGVYQGCSSLTSIRIPESVTAIGELAFSECWGLTSVKIPDHVTSVGKQAFEGCKGMAYLKIGESVNSIGEKAFAQCPELSDVYCYNVNVPSADLLAFEGSGIGNATLHVLTASLDAYGNTQPWSDFKNIVAHNSKEMKCATPTIAYNDGILVFDCETEGAQYVYEIKDCDVKKGSSKEVRLTPPTTTITVYATATVYDDSDVATATIGWQDGTPILEGFSSIKLNGKETNGDVNGDGTVDVADIATIISIMAGGGGNASHAPAGVEAIDLGLPSGTLWANMNVGAECPEDRGLFFAWGETTGYTSDTGDGRTFDWDGYKGTSEVQTIGEGKYVLYLKDDAAHANWGGQWVMPTYDEMQELIDNTTSEWVTQNGMKGRVFTSKTNGNTLFLPDAGWRPDSFFYGDGGGYYWTASALGDGPKSGAWYLRSNMSTAVMSALGSRTDGRTVRPIIRK